MMYRRQAKLYPVPRHTGQTNFEHGSEMAEKIGFAQTRFAKSCPIDIDTKSFQSRR